jgi:histidinol phosphatase-like enzyme
MILQARDEHGICVQNSILIGDKDWDIRAAKTAGVGTTVLISDGDTEPDPRPEFHFKNLRDAANLMRYPRWWFKLR